MRARDRTGRSAASRTTGASEASTGSAVALSSSEALDGGGIARVAGVLVAELIGGALIGLAVGFAEPGPTLIEVLL